MEAPAETDAEPEAVSATATVEEVEREDSDEGFELPPRIQTYCDDFIAACPSTEFLEAAKGFMASKE